MRLETIKSEGLAHNSYYLSDEGEALVIDPRRDCTVYTRLAQQECSRIKYILETHRNEDYVTGSLELQTMTDAEIAHSKETPFKYGEHNLSEGDTLHIGQLDIQTLYTPGHTNDSVCYVVRESTTSNVPMLVFTGDTLFVGDVGRTDLVGIDVWRRQSEKLYDSLHEKVLPLGDQTMVYPGHGAGSICGHEISDREFSTLGYERKTNPLLKLDKESFVDRMMKQKLMRPPYFRKMEQYNLNGPPPLKEAHMPKLLSAKEFEEETQKPNTSIVDTREPEAFASSHIPGSLNIWLDGLSFFPGWVLTYDQRILLVTERKEDIATARSYLWRLGFDNLLGCLCPGISEWRNLGKPVDHLGTLSAPMLKEKLDLKKIFLVDVREPSEWDEGHVKEAERIYVGHLTEKSTTLPHDQPIACICSVGYRGGLGASILKKIGFKEVYNVLGGMDTWKTLGYPVEKK